MALWRHELFYGFRCWTLTWLSHHWTWPCLDISTIELEMINSYWWTWNQLSWWLGQVLMARTGMPISVQVRAHVYGAAPVKRVTFSHKRCNTGPRYLLPCLKYVKGPSILSYLIADAIIYGWKIGLLKDSYTNVSRVVWVACRRPPGRCVYNEVLSHVMNILLLELRITVCGITIGSVSWGQPTCADDIVIVSTGKSGLKHSVYMVWIARAH